jgi:hypothetical protein
MGCFNPKQNHIMKTTDEITRQLNDAVSVIILSPEIRKFLTAYDPKALDQCFAAFNAYRNSTKTK